MLTAIVLAAGMSRRMEGENKLLLPLGDKTMLETTLDHILAAGIEDIVVVLGHESKRIHTILGDRPVKTVYNPDYPTGLTSSIQAGVRAALPHAAGFMICLSDMPLITSTTYGQLAKIFFEEALRQPQIIVQPVFEGVPGNPVTLSSAYKNEILSLGYPDGCKPIVQANWQFVLRVPIDTDSILRDADTAADFEVMKKRF